MQFFKFSWPEMDGYHYSQVMRYKNTAMFCYVYYKIAPYFKVVHRLVVMLRYDRPLTKNICDG